MLLLEAGGLRPDLLSRETCRGEADPEEADRHLESGRHPALDTVRQRRLGGTTWSWGGRCAPLDPIDFEPREGIPHSGWPINRAHLDPYYLRAHEYCQLGEFEYRVDEALIPPSPFLLSDDQGRSILDDGFLFRYSPPTKFAKAFRREMADSPRIRVLHHANVLCFDFRDHRVTSAKVATTPGREIRVLASTFVVATGGLEAARLLLWTGARAGRSFGEGFEVVGRYYMTHLDGIVGPLRLFGEVPPPAYAYERTRDGVYCRRVIRLTEAARRRRGLLNLGAVVWYPSPHDPSHRDPVLSAFALAKQMVARSGRSLKAGRMESGTGRFPLGDHLRNILLRPWEVASFGLRWGSSRWLASRRIPSFLRPPRDGAYRLLFSAEQSPTAESRIELGTSRDPFGVPRLRPRWRVARQDYESILASLLLLGEELERQEVGTLSVPLDADQLWQALGEGFLGGTHAMGTTRMGTSSRTSVVDPDCRIHGVPNVYVASSAVFPTGGFAPPTLTIVALSLRIADHILAHSSR